MSESIAEQERRRLWRLAGMGGTLTSEILAGALIGWGLDALFGTKPTLLIIFTILGVVIGMSTFLRTALKENRKSTSDGVEIAAHLHERTPEKHADTGGDQ